MQNDPQAEIGAWLNVAPYKNPHAVLGAPAMEICQVRDIHPHRTTLSQLSYCFTPKHHGAGSRSDSCWLLTRVEEFGVFDMADQHQLSDEAGNLYGLFIRAIGGYRELMVLGTRNEQVACFWSAPQQSHWHGHPRWPIRGTDSTNRGRQDYGPPKFVLDRMVLAGILNTNEIRRLKTGNHLRRLA